MKYRLLLVEDDPTISSSLASQASSWGYDVRVPEDFSNILTEFRNFSPHAVLMDISLPFYNGYYWCAEIRKESKVPVIFLSSASDSMNIVMAMSMGGDDFIAKPFDIGVLTAKLNAMMRRAYDFTVQSMLTVGGATLDASNSVLSYRNESVILSKNEIKILDTLMSAAGKPVSRDTLMLRLWDSDCFVDDNTLAVNITRLRKKLDDIGLVNFIITQKGVGYKINDQPH